jgi:hypothetical protein
MQRHKFSVGEVVDYTPRRQSRPFAARRYKVLRLLPPQGSDLLYRIKSVDEAFERVVKEHELARFDK